MACSRPKTPSSNDIILLLPLEIRQTVAMIRYLNAIVRTSLDGMKDASGDLDRFLNANAAIRRDEVGLAEAFGAIASVMLRASIALQIQLMDNGQSTTYATGVDPFPLTTPNTTIRLNPGVAEAMKLARATRIFSDEILRLGTELYRAAMKLQDSTPMLKLLPPEKRLAYPQTQPGYYMIKGTFDARINGYRTETLADVAYRIFGDRKNWHLIAEHNGIVYPYNLSIGQILEIPDLLIPQADKILANDDDRFQELRSNLRELRTFLYNIPEAVLKEYPQYSNVIYGEGVTPSRILYTKLEPLGVDWYLDSVYDPTRGYSGRTKDFVVDERGQIAIRVGIDSFMLGMRRLFATEKGHVPLRQEFGHMYYEIVGSVKNPRLQLLLAKTATIKTLQQESDRIETVVSIETERDYDNIVVAVQLVPKGFINEFLITLPIPELGGQGLRYVNKGIPLPSPEEIRD